MKHQIVEFVRSYYQTQDFIPLHEPRFDDDEKKLVLDTIDSTFVSSVGKFVDDFEANIASYTGANKAVAVVNGTAGLYTALYQCGVRQGDMVITQALTFVATANAVNQLGAECIFVDVSKKTIGLCPTALESYLAEHAYLDDEGNCIFKQTGQKIKAVVPMHTFGFPVEIDKIVDVSKRWNISVVEDAAESLGSYYNGQHTGTFGRLGVFSFNGNKIMTTGAGGMIVSQDIQDATHLKHLTTTAKVPHAYKFFHDEPAFNYRMPNINAALGCAQLKKMAHFLEHKRELAKQYEELFENSEYQFFVEPDNTKANYWLNTLICEDLNARNDLLEYLNAQGIMSRPIWELMVDLPMYANSHHDALKNSRWFAERIVNIPSSARK